MDSPIVYIIVLNYNRRDDTLECLRSLYRSDYPNFKVMVVDNASSDGTAGAVRAEFPQAEVIENGRNLMYAGGNNIGIRLALGAGAQYILLLNNDTVVGESLVTRLVDAMERDGAAGLAGPMIYYYPPKDRREDEVIWYAGGIVKLWQGLTAHRGIREKDSGRFTVTEETGYVTGCGIIASRDCFMTTGLLDTSYILYAEDADFSLRARKAGYRLLFVPDAVMWHKVSLSTGGEFSASKIKLKLRANLILLLRYARPWHWLTIPVFTAARAANFLFRRLIKSL